MKHQNRFHFQHMIYPVHRSCTLKIIPELPVTVDAANRYEVRIYPLSGIRVYGLRNSPTPPTPADAIRFSHQTVHPLTLQDDHLELNIIFPQEDCYRFRLYVNEELIEEMELYALEEDLFCLTPFKGDCHIRTYMSDGRESPAYMVAAACKHGMDFCAITDHEKYEPSIIAKEFWANLGVDFLVLPGEEVHSPNNTVHIINLGGSASVNDWWRDHRDQYDAAVEAEMAKMHEPMAARFKFITAASQVIFDKIHEFHGLAVLCHPHWIPVMMMNQAEDVTDYLCEHQRFDVLELVAGGATNGQQLQYNYFGGWKGSVIGNSDSHGCFLSPLEPQNYSLIFAEDLTQDAIKNAFLKGFSLGGDHEKKLHGNYRLAKYGEFLERNYYPIHDTAREDLAIWMLRVASGKSGEDSTGILKRTTSVALFDQLRYR